MEPTRKFKIIVNSKECGTCSGATPSAVAKKVIKKLCGSSSKVVRFILKECKRGCERVFGPYQGRMEKLDRPCKRGGKTITHRVICGKVQKMRGGQLGNDGINLVMDDFTVKSSKNEGFPFLRLETIGELKMFKSTKEQYAFFNPIKLNNNEQNRNNNERSQAETEQMNHQTNENPIYYQYVAIRKRDKSVVFKKLKDSKISEINISEIDTNILIDLFDEIKKEIKKKREIKKDFDAKSIYEILEEYLKDKIKSNLQNDTISWRLFKIKEENPPPIKYFSFGKRTSKFGGNKNQYIFFDIVELYPHHFFYQYVVIRDKNQKISLKKIAISQDGIMEILDFGTFDSVSSNESGQGQLILEKLHRDILMLIDSNSSPESFDFSTTIRHQLSRYTFGDKEKDLVPDSFKKDKNTNDFVVNNKYVFFSDILLFKKCQNLNEENCEYTEEQYELYRNYYMFVMFLDKEKKINFKKLILFKGTPIILEVDMKDKGILKWLYRKINHLCDSKNNEHLFDILFSLEEYIFNQRRLLLKSRDFYITAQEQNKTIRILTKKRKTFIFFKRLKGKRTIHSNEDFILYEYAIIIDENDIKFYTIKDHKNNNKELSVLIEEIREITLDDIDVLLLTLLYEELIQLQSGNNNSINNLKRLKGLLYQKIGKFYEFKKKVEKILASNIKNNKITINGVEKKIEYDGRFTFDFFDNENNQEELKDFLKRILQKKNIKMTNNNDFKFKPYITSIVGKRQNNLNNQLTYKQLNNELPRIISISNS